jgi:hypothetical protein
MFPGFRRDTQFVDVRQARLWPARRAAPSSFSGPAQRPRRRTVQFSENADSMCGNNCCDSFSTCVDPNTGTCCPDLTGIAYRNQRCDGNDRGLYQWRLLPGRHRRAVIYVARPALFVLTANVYRPARTVKIFLRLQAAQWRVTRCTRSRSTQSTSPASTEKRYGPCRRGVLRTIA